MTNLDGMLNSLNALDSKIKLEKGELARTKFYHYSKKGKIKKEIAEFTKDINRIYFNYGHSLIVMPGNVESFSDYVNHPITPVNWPGQLLTLWEIDQTLDKKEYKIHLPNIENRHETVCNMLQGGVIGLIDYKIITPYAANYKEKGVIMGYIGIPVKRT